MVVGVGAVLFVVINFWFVVPHFSDWGKVKIRMAKARETLAMFDAEIAQSGRYEREVRKLEGEGLAVPPEDQSVHFQGAIRDQQIQSGVNITSMGRQSNHTNQFFLELSQPINVQSKEQQLVDFLYNLGSGNSLIRVKDLTLRTDPPRQQLMAAITLVASYQKKPSRNAPASTSKAPATAAKAAAPTPKPSTPAPKSIPPPTTPGNLPGKLAGQTNRPPALNTKRP